VRLGEAQEEPVQLRAVALAERLEELVLVLARQRTQATQHPGPVRGHPDEVPPTVLRIALALDQPQLLELVEQPDELAAVIPEGVGDRALGVGRSRVEDEHDRVVVRMHADLVVGRHPALFRGESESFEQERRRRDELLGQPRGRAQGDRVGRLDLHLRN